MVCIITWLWSFVNCIWINNSETTKTQHADIEREKNWWYAAFLRNRKYTKFHPTETRHCNVSNGWMKRAVLFIQQHTMSMSIQWKCSLSFSFWKCGGARYVFCIKIETHLHYVYTYWLGKKTSIKWNSSHHSFRLAFCLFYHLNL